MHGAIAAGHELTVHAGASVLDRGGNAVDAAVAAGAMSWTSEVALTGPLGGGFLLVRPHGRRATLLDAFTSIPGLGLEPERAVVPPDRVDVPFDERTTQVFHIGPGAAAVPGVTHGLYEAHRRFGRLPWRDLLLPAADAAQRGVALNGGQAAVFKAIEVVMTHTPEARELFAPDGRFAQQGDVVRQPELAATIELLAERGPGELVDGSLARAIVEHQRATGGPLTMADLAAYRPVWRRPARVGFGGCELVTNPAPSSGGSLIAHTLAVLDGVRPLARPGSAEALRALAEALRATARVRDDSFERLRYRGGLLAALLDPARIEGDRAAVRAGLEGAPSGAPVLAGDRGTTHISVIDGEGTAVAFTASNGCHSGVIVPGTGLHLNNMMGEEDLAAGSHRPPGARITSMQSPSALEDGDGGLRMVLGSSGSNRLRSAIAQVVVNVVEHGMGVEQAVSFPRVHVEGPRLDVEGGFAAGELERLEAWGEQLNRFDGHNLYFGGANAVLVAPDGALTAAGDPRRDCAAAVL